MPGTTWRFKLVRAVRSDKASKELAGVGVPALHKHDAVKTFGQGMGGIWALCGLGTC